jgi:predicted secreted protein
MERSEYTVTETGRTSRISVDRDHEFDIELESYPGSGAKWQLVPQGDAPRLVKQANRPGDQSIGDAATQVFTFHPEAPGTYKLLFELKRQWEPTARNRKEITVEVT